MGSANSGSAAAKKDLFTTGGCHAFAFANALHLNGTAELMTKIAIRGEFSTSVEERKHAWCKAGSRFLDYFGEAKDREVILAKFSDEVGWCPKFVPGTKPHTVELFSPSEIREVFSEAKKLPIGFYDDIEWLNEAVTLASKNLH